MSDCITTFFFLNIYPLGIYNQIKDTNVKILLICEVYIFAIVAPENQKMYYKKIKDSLSINGNEGRKIKIYMPFRLLGSDFKMHHLFIFINKFHFKQSKTINCLT